MANQAQPDDLLPAGTGRLVVYRLTGRDADAINGAPDPNTSPKPVYAGDICAAVVVRRSEDPGRFGYELRVLFDDESFSFVTGACQRAMSEPGLQHWLDEGTFAPLPIGCGSARREKLAILRMLTTRATLLDRWRARRLPGHWLNRARRETAAG